MKKYRLFVIALNVFLAGCTGGNTLTDNNSHSDTTFITDITSDVSAELETEQIVLSEYTHETMLTQNTVQTEQTVLAEDTQGIALSEYTHETTLKQNTVQTEQTVLEEDTQGIALSEKYSVYTDINDLDNYNYIIISVTPIKVYWNYTDKTIPIEETINIYVPHELYSIVSNADSLLIYFDKGDINYPITFADNDPQVSFGKRKLATLYSDLILPVKDGKINLYTNEDLLAPYEFIENNTFLLDANNIAEGIKFNNNMLEKDFDVFISDVEKNYVDLTNARNNTPGLEVEPFSFEGYMNNGIYFKAKINQVY